MRNCEVKTKKKKKKQRKSQKITEEKSSKVLFLNENEREILKFCEEEASKQRKT